jgi:cell division septum initiation protein DivIVA
MITTAPASTDRTAPSENAAGGGETGPISSLHSELEQEIIRLKLELAEAKTLNAHTRKERDDANERNARAKQEREDLRAELDQVKRQVDDLAIENTNLKFNSVKLSHDLDIFQRENEELDRRNRYLEENHNHEQHFGRRPSGHSQDNSASMNSIAEHTSGSSDGSISRCADRSVHLRSSRGGERPHFGRRESSSKVISAFQIYGAIEDQCLLGGNRADHTTRRMSVKKDSQNSSASSIMFPERVSSTSAHRNASG